MIDKLHLNTKQTISQKYMPLFLLTFEVFIIKRIHLKNENRLFFYFLLSCLLCHYSWNFIYLVIFSDLYLVMIHFFSMDMRCKSGIWKAKPNDMRCIFFYHILSPYLNHGIHTFKNIASYTKLTIFFNE